MMIIIILILFTWSGWEHVHCGSLLLLGGNDYDDDYYFDDEEGHDDYGDDGFQVGNSLVSQ